MILFSNSYQIRDNKIIKSISDSLSCVSISFGKMKSSMQRWVHCVHTFLYWMRNRRKGEKWSKSINVVGVSCRGEEIISRPQPNIFTYRMKKRRKKRKKQFCTVAGKKRKTYQICALLFRQIILFPLFFSFYWSSPLFNLKASINTQWNSGLQSTNHLKW